MTETIQGTFAVITNLQGKLIIDARKTAMLELAEFCKGIIPYDVPKGCEPDARDGIELAKDLALFAAKVDRVVEAYGLHCRDVFGSEHIDLHLFDRQLAGALEGNALYEIESAGDTVEQDRLDAAEDDAAEGRREFRFSGVL